MMVIKCYKFSRTFIRPEQPESTGNTITLPDDYSPFLLLDQIESLFKFTNRAYHSLPEIKIKVIKDFFFKYENTE